MKVEISGSSNGERVCVCVVGIRRQEIIYEKKLGFWF